MDHFQSLANSFTVEAALYKAKPTKASAKRLRDIINQMQKIAVSTKKTLIDLDKAGY